MRDETKQDYGMTRTTIQKTIEPAIKQALDAAGILGANDPAFSRRFFRAMVTLGVQQLLAEGAGPNLVLQQALVAISEEVHRLGLDKVPEGTVEKHEHAPKSPVGGGFLN